MGHLLAASVDCGEEALVGNSWSRNLALMGSDSTADRPQLPEPSRLLAPVPFALLTPCTLTPSSLTHLRPDTLYLLHCPTSYTSTLSTLSRTQPSSLSTSYAFPSTFFISAVPSHTPSPILSPFYTHHYLHVAPFYRVCHLHSQTFTFSSSYSPPPSPSSPPALRNTPNTSLTSHNACEV